MPSVKKVAAIHDLSGFGRCSLTVAIPVISSMGFQVCPFPTAVLSAHTGLPHYSFKDLTPEMEEYAHIWDLLGIEFDAVYTGFLGSEKQIDTVEKFLENRKCIKIVDPVMGDDGKIYRTYTESMCRKMENLCRHADVITPNLTEACILAKCPFPKGEPGDGEIENLLERLSFICKGDIVITGIPRNGSYVDACRSKGKMTTVMTDRIDIQISGAGDLFSSVLCGCLMAKNDFVSSVRKSSEFVKKAMKLTSVCGADPSEGIVFEPLLKDLPALLEEKQ